MFLALKEIRRSLARFGLLSVAIALLVFLILFQQSLQSGLITSFVGAIRNQDAPVLVYSVDGQRTVQGSVLPPDLEELVASTDEVENTGRWYQGGFTFAPGGDNEAVEGALIGFDTAGLGTPRDITSGRLPEATGEGVASDADAEAGFDIGDVVTITPGDVDIEIVGLASDTQLSAGPTVFASDDTYLEAVRAVNPDATDPPPNVLTVQPASGVSDDQASAAINDRSDELDALPRGEAAEETPGVAEVSQSFQVLYLLYALVVPCVTGLFFLIVTFQKARALTLLRAIGAPARRLASALIIQAALMIGTGFALGTLAYFPVSQQRVGTIPLRFETGAVVFWAVTIGVLGLGSALLAVRRVLALDPASATVGGEVGT